jgi:hypothetical protein
MIVIPAADVVCMQVFYTTGMQTNQNNVDAEFDVLPNGGLVI